MQSILSYDGSIYFSPKKIAQNETFRSQYSVKSKMKVCRDLFKDNPVPT